MNSGVDLWLWKYGSEMMDTPFVASSSSLHNELVIALTSQRQLIL
jgi:hypothetical protein